MQNLPYSNSLKFLVARIKPFVTPKSLVHTNVEVDEECLTPTIIYLIYIKN
jgi:hypothetical protein